MSYKRKIVTVRQIEIIKYEMNDINRLYFHISNLNRPELYSL